MAVVKSPAMSMEASGNMGAICYSRHRGLRIARGVWTGTYSTSPKREAVQNRTVVVSKAWSGTLTAEQRQEWREAAKTQTRVSRGFAEYIPSGYQLFLEVNILRLRVGVALLKSPCSGSPDGSVGDVELKWDGLWGQVEINLIEVFNLTANYFYIDVFRAGPYSNGGRHAISGEYRALDLWAGLVSGTDGTVDLGKFYWYKVRWLWSRGATGNWFERQVYTG